MSAALKQTDIEDTEYLGKTTQPTEAQPTLTAGELATALGAVREIAERADTIPILSCVKIEAAKQLRLTCTNMEIAVTAALPWSGVPLVAAAPALPLYELLRRAPRDAAVTLARKGDVLTVKAGQASARFTLQDEADFPVFSPGVLPHNFVIPAATFRYLIDKVRFAVNADTTRYYLCGVYLHVVGLHLRSVATNRSIIAIAGIDLPTGAADMPATVIPTRTIAFIRKLLDALDDTEEVSVGLSGTRIKITSADRTILSKLVDGSFPEYERAIPTENPNTLRVIKAPFLGGVATLGAFSDNNREPVVKLEVGPDRVVLCARSERLGDGDVVLSSGDFEYEGATMKIGLQAAFLSGVGGAISGDMQFELRDADTPVRVTDSADPAVQFVISPYRI